MKVNDGKCYLLLSTTEETTKFREPLRKLLIIRSYKVYNLLTNENLTLILTKYTKTVNRKLNALARITLFFGS